jgi:hypothetical protein
MAESLHEDRSDRGSRITGYSDLSLGEHSQPYFGVAPEHSMNKGWVRAGDFLVREDEWVDIDASQSWNLTFIDEAMEHGCAPAPCLQRPSRSVPSLLFGVLTRCSVGATLTQITKHGFAIGRIGNRPWRSPSACG